MLAWAGVAAVIGGVSAVLGFSSLVPGASNIALLITCAAMVLLLASFEAHEAQGPGAGESGED